MQLKHLTTSVAFAAIAACASTTPPASESASNKAIATEALGATLGAGNPDAVDQYFDPSYIQHNPDVPSGSEALKSLITTLAESGKFKADFARVIADDDMVAFHGRYEGFGPQPMIAFDVFRLEDGKIVEHWDNLTVEAAPNPSGHTQIDGSTEITNRDKTEDNKALVADLLTRGLVNGEELDFTQYINPQLYIQHNSSIGDGLMAFGGFLHDTAEQGKPLTYNTVHQVIGEGNFVLAMSDGQFGTDPMAFYDLFRVEDGLIVEHWDIITPMPGPDAKFNEVGKF